MWNKPCKKAGVRQSGISPHCRRSTGTKTTRPGTCTQQPHHTLGPFGTDKHFSWSAITYFCLEKKDSPSKAAPKSVLIQPSLKASSCRHSQVLTPALIFYCCLIFGISSATSAGVFLYFFFFNLNAVKVASVLLTIFDLPGCRLRKPSLDDKIAK